MKFAFQFGYGDKIAPRLGASFDLFGNGKMKISDGWGRYYDWTKLDLARGTFDADLWHIFYRKLDTSHGFSLGLSNMPGDNTFRDPRLPGFNFVDPKIKCRQRSDTGCRPTQTAKYTSFALPMRVLLS